MQRAAKLKPGKAVSVRVSGQLLISPVQDRIGDQQPQPGVCFGSRRY
jgi:hypothetical protein